MVLGLITSAVNFVKDSVSWFFNTAPKPFQIIIFLFLLLLIGGTINGFFTSDYSCNLDENGKSYLVVDLVSGKSGSLYDSYFIQQIIEQNLTFQNRTAEHNATIEGIKSNLGLYSTMINILSFMNNAKSGVIDGFLGRADGSEFGSFGAFSSRIFDPQNYVCDNLYRAIDDDDINNNLGLFKGCEISDMPSAQDWLKYTKGNSTGVITGEFNINCIAESPQLSFFGFPLLDYRFWVLMIILFTGFFIGAKWRSHLKNH